MKLLLDTDALIWWLAGDAMSEAAVVRIADPANVVAVSAASAWEIGIKTAIGKLRVEGSIAEEVDRGGFDPIPISMRDAERAGALPPHHRDPFDRMLVAQAQLGGYTLVSRDPAFDAYDVAVLPC